MTFQVGKNPAPVIVMTSQLVKQSHSGESKPERTGTPFRGPENLKSVPGPHNVRIFTGTLDSSPFRGPNALLDFVYLCVTDYSVNMHLLYDLYR